MHKGGGVKEETVPHWTYHVLVRLVHQVSGLGLGVVIVLWHDPVADFIQVHLAVFVQVSEVGKLLPLGLDPVRLWTSVLVCKHVGLTREGGLK